MKMLEKELENYKKEHEKILPSENKIMETIKVSREAFYEAEERRNISYMEFLWQQAGYIKKYWWILQMVVLIFFWMKMYVDGQDVYTQRYLGVGASLIVIFMIPEFWKNEKYRSVEIESAAYYSLRQIYAARLVLFGMTDILLLSFFFGIVSMTLQITIQQMMVQFLLPLNVNAAICCFILCSRRFHQEYTAIGCSVFWAGVWTYLIRIDRIYALLSTPVWIGTMLFSIICLMFGVQKLLGNCEKYWEENPLWN